MENNIRKLQKVLEEARRERKKIALCHGCFDGLHEGHLSLFRKAKEVATIVVVGIENDGYITRVKNDQGPFLKLQDRIKAIKKTGLVDHIFIVPTGDAKIYKKLYLDLRPDYLVTVVDEIIQKKKKDAVEASIRLVTIKEKNHSSCDIFYNGKST